MNEKIVPYESRPPRRRQRPRRRSFPWGDLLAAALAVAIFAFALSSVRDQFPHYASLLLGEQRGESLSTQETPPAEETGADHDDTGWELLLVNSENPVPEGCQPDLVELVGGERVDRRICGPLGEMLEAAKEENWGQLPVVVSGYRTQEKQQSLYEDRVAKYKGQGYSGEEARQMAEQWVALPGYSEHQTGMAVDINGATYDLYLWLQANSYQYGFIFRYPGSKTELTGVAEEVWHYRYVGVEAATEMYEQGLCLEEYLALHQGETP